MLKDGDKMENIKFLKKNRTFLKGLRLILINNQKTIDILGIDGNMTVSNGMAAIHKGFVKDIQRDETGGMKITLTRDMDSPAMMTMSLPGQTSAYLVY